MGVSSDGDIAARCTVSGSSQDSKSGCVPEDR